MIRGIFCTVSQTFNGKLLWDMFKCFANEKYAWHVIDDQSEIWANSNNNDFFEFDCYNTKEFLKCVSRNHYAVFLKLQIYNEIHEFSKLHTYDDFLNSDCLMAVLINDCEFVEIYIKDEKILNRLYDSLVAVGCKSIEYLTDDNDSRAKLNVL